MKIVLSDKVYVQRNDLAYLMRTLDGKEVPASIINKVFSDVFVCCDSNRYEFMEFTSEDEIKFFKELEYSVDYMELRDKSVAEIIVLGEELASKMNEIAKKFNALDEVEKGENLHLIDEHDLTEFKLYSLRDIAWFKQGKLKMKLPKEARNPSVLDKLVSKFKKR